MKPAKHSPVRIGRARRRAVYFVSLGVWLSGGLWLLFHYFCQVKGEFGPQTNPLEPLWLRVHGAFAFAAIWIFGLLWGIHVTTAWPVGRRRGSGGLLTSIFLFLIVTGYLLYYVGAEAARPIISALHWSVGLGAPFAFLWHRWKRRRQKRTVLQEQRNIERVSSLELSTSTSERSS